MMTDKKFVACLILSILAGLLIAWMDSSPGWDDTGITVGAIVLTSAIFGYVYPSCAWTWAMAVSIWIPIHAIVQSGNFKMLLVTLFGFAGAYFGAFIKNFSPDKIE